jgi:hypothetical protein
MRDIHYSVVRFLMRPRISFATGFGKAPRFKSARARPEDGAGCRVIQEWASSTTFSPSNFGYPREMKQIFRAHFSPGGFSSTERCVYMVELRRGEEVWRYVGRTGTSNNTGVSSPYKRLARHLAKVGTTQSCIWEDSTTAKVSIDLLEKAEIFFTALPLENKKLVDQSEHWLHWKLRGTRTLNQERPAATEPALDPLIKERLVEIFRLGASK